MKRSVERYTLDLATEHAYGKFDRMLRTLGYVINGVKFCIKHRALTDFSSTPNFYDALITPIKLRMAGAVHDGTYKTGEDCEGNKVTRAEADMAWREIAQLGEYSANKFEAWAGWLGLRAGGWKAWNKYRREDQLKEYR